MSFENSGIAESERDGGHEKSVVYILKLSEQ